MHQAITGNSVGRVGIEPTTKRLRVQIRRRLSIIGKSECHGKQELT